MRTRIGLWIDHRKAVVLAIADSGEETTLTIKSKVERQPGRFESKHSTTPYESQQVSAGHPKGPRGYRKPGLDLQFLQAVDLHRDGGRLSKCSRLIAGLPSG